MECDEALKLLRGNREERIKGLRIFCEYRDKRSFSLLLPLLDQPCPVERMSAVYALGRNPFPSAVEKLVSLFGLAFFAVSARIWLPGDMMSPAPIN